MKSSGPNEDLTIGELADRFGIATHVLRHWEATGLLVPDRHSNGHRRYGPDDLARVAMILMGKEAGLGLAALRVLMSGPDPMNHTALLHEHIAILERRIAEAQSAKSLIEHALGCPLSFDECPHAREQIAARIPPPTTRHSSRGVLLPEMRSRG